MKNQPPIQHSPTFCVFPFVHFLAGPSEHWRLCCVAQNGILDENKEPYLLSDRNPKELWNSEGMRQIRKKMWEGKKLPQCRHCYYQESVNRKSYRQRSNEEWLKQAQVKKIISESVKNDFYVKEDPLYLDLRPGNLCNLKCRMCNPGNSSKIEAEWKKLADNKDFQTAIGERASMFKHKGKVSAVVSWEKKGDFWNSLEDWTAGLRKLYLTGGEPTLIKNNWKLIDRLIETKRSRLVSLVFNINCTKVPESLLNTFDHFENVCLNLSLDGYGETNDYIRDPSHWEQVEDNVRKILRVAKGKNVDIRVTPVVQVYNILSLCELFHWVDNLEEEFSSKIVIELLILDKDPDCLDIRILPEKVREISLKRIKDYLKKSSRVNWDSAFKNCAESVIYILENVIHKQREERIHQFKKYTDILDKLRGNSFQSSLPELNQLIPLDVGEKNQRENENLS